MAGALAAHLLGKPHIWHVREILGGPAWSVLRLLILGLSDRVVAISDAAAQNLAPPGSTAWKRIVTIPDGIDTEFFLPRTVIAGDRRPSVGIIARITPQKGHAFFLQAAKLVASQDSQTRFLLIGGCVPAYADLRRRLVAFAEELGLGQRVQFIDHVEREALRDLMTNSLDVVVLPSIGPEGGGLVLLEAMACGLPVIATRHGGPVGIVRHGRDGFLVSPRDPNEMASAITELVTKPELRLEMGREARQRVVKDYSLATSLRSLTSVYQEVVSKYE
jgi:glycosyltransferase involved in cell wall biosynthesis